VKTTYRGNVEISSHNVKEWQKKLKHIKKITGYLSVYSNVKLEAPNLQTVGGYLYVYSNVKLEALQTVGGDLIVDVWLDIETEKRLWKHNYRRKWYVTDLCSDWLLQRKGNFGYRINNIDFNKELFNSVRKDTLTAEEVFQIQNMEQRRIAYERMNKIKMREFDGLKVLDETVDDYNNPMKIITFNIDGFNEPFKYLNCFCPSTGREYFLETRKDTCIEAKSASFGLHADFEFNKEY